MVLYQTHLTNFTEKLVGNYITPAISGLFLIIAILLHACRDYSKLSLSFSISDSGDDNKMLIQIRN